MLNIALNNRVLLILWSVEAVFNNINEVFVLLNNMRLFSHKGSNESYSLAITLSDF